VMALRHFAEKECKLVIWETGLGGRLDATNIVTPLASVITNIQYDHEKWLGSTLSSIAAEKAGIIKPDVPVITATDEPEAFEVIQATARKNGVALTVVRREDADMPPLNTIKIPLLGEHQRLNAAVALATVRAVSSIRVADESIRRGLSEVQWPGRMQLITRRPSGQVLLDGAHNVAGARVLKETLKQYFADRRTTRTRHFGRQGLATNLRGTGSCGRSDSGCTGGQRSDSPDKRGGPKLFRGKSTGAGAGNGRRTRGARGMFG